MKEEYTSNTYPSMGKKYNGEKAIISLTSWKARINTVSKTLFSLIKQCPGFHIVLVLSEEEFPLMEKELPEDLMLFVNNKLIEILWVYRNYKAFKKVLFTMDKYRDVPVISADDDCIYQCNYAEILYKKWKDNKNYFISCYKRPEYNTYHLGGAATLYPPYVFKEYGLKYLTEKIYKSTNQDDDYYTCVRNVLNLTNAIMIEDWKSDYKKLYIFHDEISPCHDELRNITKENRKKISEMIFSEIRMLQN